MTVLLAIQPTCNFGLNFLPVNYILINMLFCFVLDDTLEVDSEGDLPEDSPFLEAVKQMKEKKYDNMVDLCTQQIEKGLCSKALIVTLKYVQYACQYSGTPLIIHL